MNKKLKRAGKPKASAKKSRSPVTSFRKKQNTSEENRGGQFFSVIKMWRLLHIDGGRTIFNKQELARRYFEGIENEENPEPEIHARDLEDEFDDDWDEGDWLDEPHDVKPSTRRASGRKIPTAYSWIKEKHKRFVQRQVEKLARYGIGIDDTDEHGNKLDDDALQNRREKHPTAERWYRYNPNGEWAEEFDTLLNAYSVHGTELLAFMALGDLLEDMQGTPHQKALQNHLDRMMKCVPPKLRDAAVNQAWAYRHSVSNASKYLRKAADLEHWYAAAIQREQVVVDYTTPGEGTRPRHLAALSTMFHREENSIYLLGSEKTATGWGPVRQWKLDRVVAVNPTSLKNPRLTDLPPDPLIQPAPGSGFGERLDVNRVYDYSAGAWIEFGGKSKRLEVVVRMPDASEGESDDITRTSRLKAARRRAYGWMEWCREKPFHPRQIATMETRSDGEKQLRLVVENCYVSEMASRLLRLQDCFEVVEPRELKVLIRDYAKKISSRHM